jgi:hypothetical protein
MKSSIRLQLLAWPRPLKRIAVLFLAGPGAIATALLFDGSMKERMFAALVAGLIATLIVVLAAGVGTSLISFLNLNILKLTGGLAVLLIGLIIMGIKIPEKIPLIIMIIGIILDQLIITKLEQCEL